MTASTVLSVVIIETKRPLKLFIHKSMHSINKMKERAINRDTCNVIEILFTFTWWFEYDIYLMVWKILLRAKIEIATLTKFNNNQIVAVIAKISF